MRIDTPSIREDDLPVDLNPGYGKPWGDIILSKDGRTRLQWVHEDDCDRLIKAAAELKSQIIDSRTRAAAPHGRRNLHEGRCQLCGKPEDDELHAEPVSDAEAAGILAASIITGTPLTVDSDEDGPMDDEAELRRAEEIRGNQNMTNKECIARVAHGGAS